MVSLAPSNTEVLFAVGAGPQLVGCDDHSDAPPEVAKLRRIGAAGGRFNQELIVSLRPDLVLAAEINSPEAVAALSKLGLTVFRISNPLSFDGLYENVLLAGRLTGHESPAAEVVAGLRSRVERVAARLQGLSRRPTVFYELDATDPSRPWTAGPGTFLHVLITLAGGQNFGSGYSRSFPRVSAEEVIRADPEVIILGDGRFGVTPEEVSRRAGWRALSAVKSGKVYVFDDNLASRPGPRLVDGLETLARILHPERFGP